MRLGFVLIEDVSYFDPARFQIIRNERAMTPPPDRFRAHDSSRPDLSGRMNKPPDPFAKFLCFHVIGVTAKGFVPPSRIL